MHTGNTCIQNKQEKLKQALGYLSTLSDPRAMAIIDILKEEGPASLRAIAQTGNFELSVVSALVKDLSKAGIIFAIKNNRATAAEFALNHHRLWRIYACALKVTHSKPAVLDLPYSR